MNDDTTTQQPSDSPKTTLPFTSEISQTPAPINTTQAPFTHPSNVGQQSVSGTEPHPESDDDTLANAQAVGQQLEKDVEHPQEVDLARDINQAEEYTRTH